MTVSLDAALSGLKAAQQSLDVVSNNIANASTPGYTRKILPLETLVIQGAGRGVAAGVITRNVDQTLERDLLLQSSVSQGQSVTQQYLDRIQDFSGPSDGTQSLSSAVSNLAKSFTALSDSPDNTLTLNQTLAAAQQTAGKFNDFSNLLTKLRGQTESDIQDDVSSLNLALQQVATLNQKINGLRNAGQSSADLEDQRDQAIRTVSQYIQVNVFDTGNGEVTVLTQQGQTLADESAHTVSFSPGDPLPTAYYPGGGLSGLTVNGVDIAGTPLGGSIGALFNLRDKTLPTYNAQIDELSQKLASRMNQEGLKLFTDQNGNVPASVPAGPVGYVGFAGLIKVNSAVLADPTLIRSGTTGGAVQAGSNEVVSRIAQYGFGAYAFQQATGSADISAGTLFSTLGLQPVNKVVGNVSITGANYQPALSSNAAIPAGSQFILTVNAVPHVITINPADTALDLASNINAAVGSNVASLDGLGDLVLNTNSNVTFADNTLGAAGIAALGFSFTTYNAQNPSFTVQAGTQAPVTVTITPATTAASLLASLNLVTGITASLSVPGNGLVVTPTNGGALTLVDGAGNPLAAMGITTANIAQTPFRQTGLGPDGTLSTGLLANATLEDYTRSVMAAQSEDAKTAEDSAAQESSYLSILDKRSSDASGVNIDEELSNMIRIQTAYSASARMLTASEKLLDDLMNAFQ